jgi:hypothetical protein
MSQNTQPCNLCQHFDPIQRGAKPTAHGRCVKRSLYPYIDSPGQQRPADAQRVTDPNEPARIHVVVGTGVQSTCLFFTPKKGKATKADLMAKAKGKK